MRYLGEEPIFMDCDDTLNMVLDKLEEFYSKECSIVDRRLINSKTGKIT